MIALSRSSQRPVPVVRVLGVGGAGSEVVDRLVLDGLDGVALAVANTDVQALNGSVAPEKIHLGRDITRGLGTGGDPEVGYTAAEEAAGEIQPVVAEANLLILCVGLGGGTGSGAAPLIAHFGRKAGARVVVFATLPFSFEGRRRREQAEVALAQVREQADLVVVFENDRMGEASSPTAGVQQAFVAADAMLGTSIRALVTMVRGHGLISVGLDELAAALRQRDSRCLFGHGESDSANRAHEALERALKSPLMDRGRLLADAHTVLVHVSGGTDVTLNEVTVLMNEFNRHIVDTTRIQFGLTTDQKLGRRMTVSILSSTSACAESATSRSEVPAPAPIAAPRPAPAPVRPEPVAPPAVHPVSTPVSVPVAPAPAEAALFALDPDPEPEAAPAPAPKVRATPAKTESATRPKPEPVAKKEQKAEQMPLEAPSRGRFDKGEPTIVDGQDLDVPTFMRRNVKVK